MNGAVRIEAGEIHARDLHPSLDDASLLSMNFLNEITNRFPDAISFAPGRPTEVAFDAALLHRYLDRYRAWLRDERGLDEAQITRQLFQYGRTKGVIHELLARHLAVDEAIEVDPDSIVVTVGAQEAMFLALRALTAGPRDAVLAISPTYVGLTGAARMLGIPVYPVSAGRAGIDFDDLATQLHAARAAGHRPRALYIVPDFSNPSGVSLGVDDRHRLLQAAAREDIWLLEDNPYGLFGDPDARRPTLKALDTERRVLYIESLAKSAFPGARIGFVVADQTVVGANGARGLLADELSKLKSMLTVNTSPVAQAVVAGKLLEHDCSLRRANEQEIGIYRGNLRDLLDGLQRRFATHDGIRWNTPGGGFFAVVTVPFEADDALLEYSARRHGVLWTPMRYFHDGPGGERQLRLSCSALDRERIEAGLDRLQALIEDVSRQGGRACA